MTDVVMTFEFSAKVTYLANGTETVSTVTMLDERPLNTTKQEVAPEIAGQAAALLLYACADRLATPLDIKPKASA